MQIVKRSRNEGIDFLRGISILMLMVLHCFAFSDYELGSELNLIISRLSLGVPFFFIISGYLLSFNYDEKLRNINDFSRFAAARAAKILPLYFIFLVLNSILFLNVLSSEVDLKLPRNFPRADELSVHNYFLQSLFLQGLFPEKLNKLIDGDWSVVNEVYFYILFSIIALWSRGNIFRLTSLLVSSYVVCILYTIYWIRIRVPSDGHLYYTFLVHLPEFLLGIFAFRASKSILVARVFERYSGSIKAMSVVIAIGSIDLSSTLLGSHHFFSILFSIFLLDATLKQSRLKSRVSLISIIGQESYALYLTHILLMQISYIVCVNITGWEQRNLVLFNFFLVVPLTFLISHFLFHKIDCYFVSRARGVKEN